MSLGVLDSKNSPFGRIWLHPNQAADLGMVCGGDISFFRYMPSGRRTDDRSGHKSHPDV